MGSKLIVIADDFTGANDTGVQFSKKGFSTVVTIYDEKSKHNLHESDVLVVDTESRFDSKDTAFKKVADVVDKLCKDEEMYIYKKIDSTLRGNVGKEIWGAMEASKVKLVLVAPAFPKNGRTVKDGVLLLNNVPVDMTEFSKDPITPVTCSYIPGIIKNETGKNVGLISIKEVTLGRENILKLIEDFYSKGVEIIVIDAVDDADLNAIAGAIAKIDTRFIMAGSAGLAEFIPEKFFPDSKGVKKAIIGENEKEGSTIVIAGSVSDVLREQVEFVLKEYNLEVIDLDINNVIYGRYDEEINRVMTEVEGYVKDNKDVIIRSAKERKQVDYARELGNKQGFGNFQVSQIIAKFYGELAKRICSDIKLKGLMLSGGDVAIKAAKAIGINGIMIVDEILPGIPFGYFITDMGVKIPVVTKAGAFGKENAIVNIIDYLNGGCKNE